VYKIHCQPARQDEVLGLLKGVMLTMRRDLSYC
jgi:hypothetical protein